MKKIKHVLLAALATFALIATGCKPEVEDNSGSSQSGGSTETAWSNDLIEVKGGKITGADYTNNYTGVFPKGRTVTLSDFYMSKYEITQAEYKEVMEGQTVIVDGTTYTLESEPSNCTEANKATYGLDLESLGEVQERRPVEGVTWYDAIYYCNARSQKEKLTPAYNITVTTISENHITEATVTLVDNSNGYRLPTEAEWEYAARGGSQTANDWNYTFSGANTATDNNTSYSSDSNSGLDAVGWYCYNNDTGTTGSTDVTNDVSGQGTHEVGKKAANRLGIYDMSGNVWEWCWDWWISSVDSNTDATGPASGSYRESHGGGWFSYAYACTVSFRANNSPSDRGGDLGFRVVRSSSK